MSTAQFLVTAAISVLVTLPAVLFIPRARQSPMFDRVLWVGTWSMAFLGAWFTLGNLSAQLSSLNDVRIGEVAAIPALIGAAVGALFLNGLLWLMDFFSRSQVDADSESEESRAGANLDLTMANEEQNVGSGSNLADQEQ